jgi:hypothetical protein
MIQAVGGRGRVMLPRNRAEGGIGTGLKWRMVEQQGIRSLYKACLEKYATAQQFPLLLRNTHLQRQSQDILLYFRSSLGT